MNDLENFFDYKIKKTDFYDRKLKLNTENTIIFGPPKCGKTALALLYVSTLSSFEYLYIDSKDPRFNKNLLELLNSFIIKNSIKLLILDSWEDDIIEFSTSTFYIVNKNIYHKNFKTIELMGFDFEEFIKTIKYPNPEHDFNIFIKTGTIPYIVTSNSDLKEHRQLEIIKTLFNSELKNKIFYFLLSHLGEIYTPHHIYSSLKEKIKISKDKCYFYLKELKDSNSIFWIENYKNKKEKKVMVYDFGLRSVATFKKNFSKVYENAIFLHLRKRFNNIYFLPPFTFYVPDENFALLASAFANELSIIRELDNIDNFYNIKKLEVVTMGYEEEFELDKVYIEASPFWVWAIAN